MRSLLVVLAAMAATLAAVAPAESQNLRERPQLDRSILQRIAAGQEAANRQTREKKKL